MTSNRFSGIIKAIKRRWQGLYEIDQAKILAIQQKLNGNDTGLPWVPQDKIHAFIEFEFGKNGQPHMFNVSTGVPVKLFYNTVTGELKSYAITHFLVNNGR